MNPPTAREVADVCHRYDSRDEIVADDYVPGWHGEPVEVGELAVVWGHNGWRQGIVTKVTPATVHVVFTTPGAIAENDRIRDLHLYRDPQDAARWVEDSERRNLAFYRKVLATPGPYDTPTQLTLYRSYVEEPDYVARKVRESIANSEADRATAAADPLAYLNVTKGSGDRTGRKASNLYVKER